MPAAKPTAADRTNSQKPPTTQGQATPRYNAAKHGIVAKTQIMFDESAEDLAELAAEYHQHHSPADPDQRFLVDTLINSEWRIRRTRRVEAELWDHATTTFLAEHTEAPACSSGDAFATASPTFERLQRIANSCDRTYHRAHKELQRLKAKVGQALPPTNPGSPPQQPDPEPAPAATDAPQPEQSKPTSANLASFRQNPKSPTPPPPVPAPDAPPVATAAVPESPTQAQTESQDCQNSAPDGGPENV
jgi:hypothetical protein